MPAPCWLKHLCSFRALVPVSFFLFVSLYYCLIPCSAEAGCVIQGILASLLQSLVHRRLRTTRFRSIKEPTFCSYLPSFSASGSFQMSQLSASGGQSIGVSASTSVPPMNTQDWSPLGWTGWVSLQCKGLSRVFSNTTVQKHQFICAQLSL